MNNKKLPGDCNSDDEDDNNIEHLEEVKMIPNIAELRRKNPEDPIIAASPMAQ